MMLAAWNEGVGSCPNGLREPEQALAAVGLAPDDELATVLTFGYPARERDPLAPDAGGVERPRGSKAARRADDAALTTSRAARLT